MVLGSSDSMEKRGQLLPLCLKEPPLGFQEVPNTPGRISWLGFRQFSCGKWKFQWEMEIPVGIGSFPQMPELTCSGAPVPGVTVQDVGMQECSGQLEMGSFCSQLSAWGWFWICLWWDGSDQKGPG